MRKITAFASAAAVAVAGFVVLPMAIADEVTNTASMSLTCKATPSTSLVGPQVFSADDVSVNVTSPEDVEIGEDFSTTFTIDPVNVAMPDLPVGELRSASRLKLDFVLPEGVTFTGADIDESNSNLSGFHVLPVNESGNIDPNGRVHPGQRRGAHRVVDHGHGHRRRPVREPVGHGRGVRPGPQHRRGHRDRRAR